MQLAHNHRKSESTQAEVPLQLGREDRLDMEAAAAGRLDGTSGAERAPASAVSRTGASLVDHSAVPVPLRAGERPDQHPQQGRHERQRDKDRQNHPAPPLRWFRLRPLTLDPRRPIAAPLQRCAQLLGVDLVTICAAAANVEPYVCANGTRIWSLMQLERQLRPEVYGRQQAG